MAIISTSSLNIIQQKTRLWLQSPTGKCMYQANVLLGWMGGWGSFSPTIAHHPCVEGVIFIDIQRSTRSFVCSIYTMSIDKMLVFVNLDDVKYLDDQDIVQFLVKSERSIMGPKKLLCSMTMTMTTLICSHWNRHIFC